MINVVDRVSTYPGRVKLTKSNGTTEYVTWERADEPTVAGTPINKALFDSIKADIGLASNVTVHVSKSGSDTLGNGTSSNPYLTIMKAVNSLPKNLNGFEATLNIGAGTYSEDVSVNCFSGGRVIFTGASGASVIIKSLLVSYGTRLQLTNINMSVSGSINNAAIRVTNATLIAGGTVSITGAVPYGIYVELGSDAYFDVLNVESTTNSAVFAVHNARVYAFTLQGSWNTGTGINVIGAIVCYAFSTLVAPTATATTYGGRIFTGAQTNTPNY